MNSKDKALKEWEELCTQCGKCCTEKIEMNGKIYISKKYCRFLDLETKRCGVYEKRFQAEPGCMDVPKGIAAGIFPADCPYIEKIEGYQAAIEEWDDPEVTEAMRELLGDDAV